LPLPKSYRQCLQKTPSCPISIITVPALLSFRRQLRVGWISKTIAAWVGTKTWCAGGKDVWGISGYALAEMAKRMTFSLPDHPTASRETLNPGIIHV